MADFVERLEVPGVDLYSRALPVNYRLLLTSFEMVLPDRGKANTPAELAQVEQIVVPSVFYSDQWTIQAAYIEALQKGLPGAGVGSVQLLGAGGAVEVEATFRYTGSDVFQDPLFLSLDVSGWAIQVGAASVVPFDQTRAVLTLNGVRAFPAPFEAREPFTMWGRIVNTGFNAEVSILGVGGALEDTPLTEAVLEVRRSVRAEAAREFEWRNTRWSVRQVEQTDRRIITIHAREFLTIGG